MQLEKEQPEATNAPVNDLGAEFPRLAGYLRSVIGAPSVRVAMDVGSRDGLVALQLKRFFPNAAVYAFECNPDAITLARKNIGQTPGVHLVERAVCDVDGPVDFFAIDPTKTVTPHADGNIGASSLFKAADNYPHETYVQRKITVEATSLKTWAAAAGVNEIDFIWMDLQGAELKALRGLGDLLQKVKLIYTEVEYRPLYVGQPLAAEVRSFLSAHGFKLLKKFNTGEWFGDELFANREDSAVVAPALALTDRGFFNERA